MRREKKNDSALRSGKMEPENTTVLDYPCGRNIIIGKACCCCSGEKAWQKELCLSACAPIARPARERVCGYVLEMMASAIIVACMEEPYGSKG